MYNENIRREFEDYLNIYGGWLTVGLLGARRNAKFLKEAEKSGQLDTYLQDFACATAFRKVFLKLGQSYVFCRNHTPIPYNQIAKAYQEKVRTNGVLTNHFLILEDSAGKRILKAIMLGEAESNGELSKVMSILKWKNPAIHLGYR